MAVMLQIWSTSIDDLAPHTVMERLDDFTKFLRTSDLPEDLPQTLFADRVERFGKVYKVSK